MASLNDIIQENEDLEKKINELQNEKKYYRVVGCCNNKRYIEVDENGKDISKPSKIKPKNHTRYIPKSIKKSIKKLEPRNKNLPLGIGALVIAFILTN